MVLRTTVDATGPRAGAVTVWLLISLLVILSIVALGMDGGRLLEKRRQVQAVADAAALAAAAQVYQLDADLSGNTWGQKWNAATAAAVDVAAANGFANDGATSVVSVNLPPTAGAFAGRTDY